MSLEWESHRDGDAISARRATVAGGAWSVVAAPADVRQGGLTALLRFGTHDGAGARPVPAGLFRSRAEAMALAESWHDTDALCIDDARARAGFGPPVFDYPATGVGTETVEGRFAGRTVRVVIHQDGCVSMDETTDRRWHALARMGLGGLRWGAALPHGARGPRALALHGLLRLLDFRTGQADGEFRTLMTLDEFETWAAGRHAAARQGASSSDRPLTA